MTEMNPYAAPAAVLDQPAPSGGGLEDAIAGKYHFEMGEVMREAWQITKGFKAPVWGAMVVAWGLLIVLSLINTLVLAKILGSASQFLVSLAIGVAFYPLGVGIMMMGVRRAAGLPVSFSTAFNYFDRMGSALLAGLLATVLMYLGLLLLIIPGIYLGVAYYMTLPLLGDRNLSAWQALEASRKAVSKQWFAVAGLFFVVGLIAMVSMLPLGIGLIWTAPWAVAVMGVLYKRIYGVASTS